MKVINELAFIQHFPKSFGGGLPRLLAEVHHMPGYRLSVVS